MLVKQIQKLKSIFMKKFSLLLFLFSLSFATLVNSCKQEASCTDGKQNQGETGIDCGDAAGKCPPCENAVSCSNGVQDGGAHRHDGRHAAMLAGIARTRAGGGHPLSE